MTSCHFLPALEVEKKEVRPATDPFSFVSIRSSVWRSQTEGAELSDTTKGTDGLTPRQRGIFLLIRHNVADRLAVEDQRVTLDAEFVKDLNADSLDLLQVVMQLEEDFKNYNLKIEDSDAEGILTARAAVEFLDERLPEDAIKPVEEEVTV